MKRARLYLAVTCLLFSLNGKAQSTWSGLPYLEQHSLEQAFYDSIALANPTAEMPQGYRSFKNDEVLWEPYLFSDNTRPTYQSEWQAQYANGLALIINSVQGEWKELGPTHTPQNSNVRLTGTGRLNSITHHPTNPKRIWVCSPTGGVFLTNDGGESWQNGGTDFLPVAGASFVAVDPRKEGAWAVATGDGDGPWAPSVGVYYTFTDGENFESMNKGLPFPEESWKTLSIHKLMAVPNNPDVLFAATNFGLYRAKGWGEPWRAVIGSEAINELEFDPVNPNRVYAGGEHLYVSNNGGGSWTRMEGAQFTEIGYEQTRINIEIAASKPNKVYVAVSGRDPKKGFYKAQLHAFENGRWTALGQLPDGSYLSYGLVPARCKAFVVDPKDADHLFVANVNPIYESNDGGLKWQKKRTGAHDDFHQLSYSSDGETLWMVTDGGVNKSTDDGESYTDQTNNIGVASVHVMSIAATNSNVAMIGCFDSGSSYFDGDPANWRTVTGGDGYDNMIDYTNDSILYSTSVNGSIYRTDNKWKNYRSVTAPSNGSDWQTWIAMNPINPEIIYQTGKSVFRNKDKGERRAWESILNVKERFPGSSIALRIYTAPAHENVLYALLIGKEPMRIVRTRNAQADAADVVWEEVKQPSTGWINELTVDDDNPLAFWTVYSQSGDNNNRKVYYNDGNRWFNYTKDLPNHIETISVTHRFGTTGQVYIGTNAGIFYTDYYSKNWTLLRGLPHCNARSLAIHYGSQQLFVGTFGRGVWSCTLPPATANLNAVPQKKKKKCFLRKKKKAEE